MQEVAEGSPSLGLGGDPRGEVEIGSPSASLHACSKRLDLAMRGWLDAGDAGTSEEALARVGRLLPLGGAGGCCLASG